MPTAIATQMPTAVRDRRAILRALRGREAMTLDQSRSFASLLRRYRVAAGLSQEALADRAGISLRGLSDLERGRSGAPRRHTLRQLSDALKLSEAGRAALAAASGHHATEPSAPEGPEILGGQVEQAATR